MSRQLPWLKDAASTKTSEARPAKRPRVLSDDDNGSPALRSSSRGRQRTLEDRARNRALSSSPVAPPSPRHEEFMRNGLAADDIWRMVEDEFLDTAKLFTQHLHRAEYARLKSLASSQNERKMEDIIRPVAANSKQTPRMKLSKKADALSDGQQAALKKYNVELHRKVAVVDSSDEDELPWTREPHLAKLMRREPTARRDLAATIGTHANTRAAAGYREARKPSPEPGTRSTHPGQKRRGLDGLAQELGLVATTYISDDPDDLDVVSESTAASPRLRIDRLQPPGRPAPSQASSSHSSKISSTHSAPAIQGVRDVRRANPEQLLTASKPTSERVREAFGKPSNLDRTGIERKTSASAEAARERLLKRRLAAKAEKEQVAKPKKKLDWSEIALF